MKLRDTAAVLLLWCVLAGMAAWLAARELPCPRGDDSFYKSPAAELVQRGALTLPSVAGYLPRVEEVFAAYPPGYQLSLAGWYAVFGFASSSSSAFCHAVHLAAALAIMLLVMQCSRHTPCAATADDPRHAQAASAQEEHASRFLRQPILFGVFAAGVAYFALLRFFDRQEELALLFGWIEMILWLRASSVLKPAYTGIWLGLAAFVSPWVGLLLAIVVTLREFLVRRPWAGLVRIAAIATVSALPIAGWLLWLAYAHPGVIEQQFIEHLFRSERGSVFDVPEKFANNFLYAPTLLPILLLALLFAPRWIRRPQRFSEPDAHSATSSAWNPPTAARLTWCTMLSLMAAAVIGVVLAALTRANSYNYLWAALMLLFPCFGFGVAVVLEQSRGQDRLIFGVIVAATLVIAFRDLAALVEIGVRLPPEEQPALVQARLYQLVPAGDLVATTSRHWHIFQSRNPWQSTMIVPWIGAAARQRWRWLVLPLHHGSPELRQQLASGFVLVERFPETPMTITNSYHPEDRTWGFELYRRDDNAEQADAVQGVKP